MYADRRSQANPAERPARQNHLLAGVCVHWQMLAVSDANGRSLQLFRVDRNCSAFLDDIRLSSPIISHITASGRFITRSNSSVFYSVSVPGAVSAVFSEFRFFDP
jgi:hypothetical protein